MPTNRANISSETRRLRRACLFAQIAIVLGLVMQFDHATTELVYHMTGFVLSRRMMLSPHLIVHTLWLALIVLAVLGLTRGARWIVTMLGGALIFNLAIIALVRAGLSWAQRIGIAITGERLIAADPLAPIFARVPHWAVDAIWLAMIAAGLLIAADVNRRFDRRLVSRRRFRRLTIAAAVAWFVWLLRGYAYEPVVALSGLIFGDIPNLSMVILYFMSYQLLILLPTAIFGVMAIIALRDVRRALADPGRVPCPYCGYDLRNSVEPRCPECGAPRAISSAATT